MCQYFNIADDAEAGARVAPYLLQSDVGRWAESEMLKDAICRCADAMEELSHDVEVESHLETLNLNERVSSEAKLGFSHQAVASLKPAATGQCHHYSHVQCYNHENDELELATTNSYQPQDLKDWVTDSTDSVATDSTQELARDPELLQIYVKDISTPEKIIADRSIVVDALDADSIADLKARIQAKTGIATSHQHLALAGKECCDEHTLLEYKLKNYSTIYLMVIYSNLSN